MYTEGLWWGGVKQHLSELLVPLDCLGLWYLVIQINKILSRLEFRPRNHDSLLK